MNADETIQYIIQNHCSVARLGDGELSIISYGIGLKFQRPDKNLQKALIKVIHSKNSNLLVCLTNRLNIARQNERKKLPFYWQDALKHHLHYWIKPLDKQKLYGDASMSRLVEGKTEEAKYAQILHIKQIWNQRTVIIIEGSKTRFGVGNDLLDNAKQVYRILGPAESAYDCFDELFQACVAFVKKENDPSLVVLLALGPTATVLASTLADSGIWAIDIGHLDICYEQLKRGTNGTIPGKYTNEVSGGNIVDDCFDDEYLSQIVYRCTKL